MKNLIAILLSLVYAINAMGVVIHFHYCHGQLAKVSLLSFDRKMGCESSLKGTSKDCCRDEMKYQKSETHRYPQPAQIPEDLYWEVAFTNNYFELLVNQDRPENTVFKVQLSPPQPIYLINRVFLI